MTAINLEELLLLSLVVHDGVPLDNLDLEDGVPLASIAIQLNSKLLNLFRRDCRILLDNVHIEVRCEVMNMGTN